MKKLLFILAFALILGCSKEESNDKEQETVKYTVSITPNPTNGGIVSPDGGQFNQYQQVTFNVSPNQNYEFEKWSGDWNSTDIPLTLTIDRNMDIVMNFKLKDSDGDGVTDDIDLCPNTPSGSLVDENGCFYLELTYGGGANDSGYSVKETSDGGFIVGGSTRSYGNGLSDIYLIKTDATGNIEWEKTFGGGDMEYAESIEQTEDGGYILVGSVTTEQNSKVLVLKLNPQGDKQWEKTFGGSIANYGRVIKQTPNGNYILVGNRMSEDNYRYNLYAVKLDSNGNMLWEKTFGSDLQDEGYSVEITPDNGFVLAGFNTTENDGKNMYVVKVDSDGTLQWENSFGGSEEEIAYDIKITKDDGFAVVGRTLTYGSGSSDFYLVKITSGGELQWSKTFGGSQGETALSIDETADGGLILVGYTFSYGNGGRDVYVVKANSNGDLSWEKVFGGSGWDYGEEIQELSNGGFVVIGSTASYGNGEFDVYMIRLE